MCGVHWSEYVPEVIINNFVLAPLITTIKSVEYLRTFAVIFVFNNF